MTLVFTEPDILHPNSETETIFDVARILEEKYHICEIFYNKNKDFIKEQCKSLALLGIFDKNNKLESKKNSVEEKLKNRWRQFVLDGEIDIATEASRRREDPSFVDTGAYYLNMGIKVEL